MKYSPVIELPEDYEVYDFSECYDPNRELKSEYGIGKYNEKRPNMYTQELFAETRNIHMGIDIGAPVGTPIKSFADGQILYFADNATSGDYGPTLVIQYNIEGQTLYALYGHLSRNSLVGKCEGQIVSQGEVIAWVGEKVENGGWNPHLHFQLARKNPGRADMPGVVSEADRKKALKDYPDPRIVLGSLYE